MKQTCKQLACFLALCLVLCLLPFSAARAQSPPAAAPPPDAPPQVPAGAWLVMDAASGQVLVSSGGNVPQYPASITKIMTMALVLENVDYEKEKYTLIETSGAAVDALIPRASMIALGVGEKVTLEDLLYATKIESANDASHVLAEYVAGSMEAFAQMMNDKLAQLGLFNSHFVNPSGQPDQGHSVTAYDMAAVTRWALGVPGFRQLWGATQHGMQATNLRPGRTLHNANLAMAPRSGYYCEGVTGSKTGYTDQAQYTLVTSAMRGGTELICVVLSCQYSSAKYISTQQLMDYCFNNFRLVELPLEDIKAGKVPVYGGGQSPIGEIDVYGQGVAKIMLHNSLLPGDVKTQYTVPQKYVMGEAFLPMASFSLSPGISQQQGGLLYSVPLTFKGLDRVLANNTNRGALLRMASDEPLLFWTLAVGLPALLAVLLFGRIAYVQRGREKRRKEKLAAARRLIPIAIEPRPQPPSRDGEAAYRRPSTPHLRVAKGNGTADYPRRVGGVK